MMELYQKYYTVRLYSCPDLHFAPTIIDIPGEYDTEEEARAAAEPEYLKTCSYYEINGERKPTSWFEVQVLEHYKKFERKKGKWKKILIATVPFTIYGYECPFCEFRTATDSFNYCPHCGEWMEVDVCSLLHSDTKKCVDKEVEDAKKL